MLECKLASNTLLLRHADVTLNVARELQEHIAHSALFRASAPKGLRYEALMTGGEV